MNKAVMCFDIGGSFIKSAVMTADGHLQLPGRIPMPVNDWPAFCHAITGVVQQAVSLLDADSPIAVSAAGVVDPQSGNILAGNIPAFRGHNVAGELRELLKRPVVIANDADCFTLAEATTGSGQGCSVVAGIILGSGVGGGIVINRQILTGPGGLTGEWGHGPITRTGFDYQGQKIDLPRLQCGCGQQGCLDTLGGARGLERLYRLLSGGDADSRKIISDWQQQEPAALQVVTLWSQLVSEVLAVVVNLLGPDKVIAGGGLASEPALVTLLDAEVRARILRTSTESLVVPATHQQQAGLIGAGMLGRQLT